LLQNGFCAAAATTHISATSARSSSGAMTVGVFAAEAMRKAARAGSEQQAR
jgi:hypothetical protein